MLRTTVVAAPAIMATATTSEMHHAVSCPLDGPRDKDASAMIADTPPPALAERAHAIAAALITELTRHPDASEAQIAGLLTLHTAELAALVRSAAADSAGPLVHQVGEGLVAE